MRPAMWGAKSGLRDSAQSSSGRQVGGERVADLIPRMRVALQCTAGRPISFKFQNFFRSLSGLLSRPLSGFLYQKAMFFGVPQAPVAPLTDRSAGTGRSNLETACLSSYAESRPARDADGTLSPGKGEIGDSRLKGRQIAI
jgi:hypothetical protein